jgi:predicted GNAT family N-acyltransferase
MKTKKTIFLLAGLMYYRQLNKTLIFREITDKNELENAFRFRYEEYAKSRLNVFLKPNEAGLDLDIYDLHSRHYSLFKGEDEMIGYIRVVLDRTTCYNPKVYEIGEKFGFFTHGEHSSKAIIKSKEPDYPFLSYENVPEKIEQHYQSLIKSGAKILEASRLIIREDYRGMRNTAFLVESAISLYVNLYREYHFAVADCVKEHHGFYRRYGFREVQPDSPARFFNMSRLLVCLLLPLSPASIPSDLLSRFDEMALEFRLTGRITTTL